MITYTLILTVCPETIGRCMGNNTLLNSCYSRHFSTSTSPHSLIMVALLNMKLNVALLAKYIQSAPCRSCPRAPRVNITEACFACEVFIQNMEIPEVTKEEGTETQERRNRNTQGPTREGP